MAEAGFVKERMREHKAAAVPSVEAVEPVAEKPKPKFDWRDLPAAPSLDLLEPGAPYDGAPIWLTPDGEPDGRSAVQGYWKRSREYDRRAIKWVKVQFWAIRNGGNGAKVPFEPLGWAVIS